MIFTESQQSFINYFNSSNNNISACILGSPGTGKSYILETIINDPYSKNKYEIIPIANTGIAAATINGYTIHKCFQFTISKRNRFEEAIVNFPDYSKKVVDLNKQPKVYTIKKKNHNIPIFSISAEENLLIIDEISSCGINMLSSIDKTLKAVFESDVDFGGVNIIVAGDFLQLDPVEDKPLWLYHNFPYRWKVFEMKESVRNNDELFKLCEEVRKGNLSVLSELMKTPRPITKERLKKEVFLFTHNKDLNEFEEKTKKFISSVPEIGTRLLFHQTVKNIVKGSLGVITSITDSDFTVETRSGIINLNSYQNNAFTPCFGATIHKFQGQTLDTITAKLGVIFEYALLNVLISRVNHKENIYIESDIICPKSAIVDYLLKCEYVKNLVKIMNEDKTPNNENINTESEETDTD